MVIDASIPLGVKPPNLMSPMEAQAANLKLSDLMAQSQLSQQQVQQGQQNLKDQQELSQLAADRSNIDPKTGGLTAEALAQLSNPMLRQKLNQSRMETMLKTREIEHKESTNAKETEERKSKTLNELFQNADSTYADVFKKTGDKKLATEASEKVQREGFDEIKRTGKGGFSSETQFNVLSPDDIARKLMSHKERMDLEHQQRVEENSAKTPFIRETDHLRKLEGQLADLSPTDPAAKGLMQQISDLKKHIAKLDAPSRTQVEIGGGKATVAGDALDLAANQLLIDGKMPAGFGRNQANVGAIYKRAAELAKEKGQTGEAAMFNAKSIKSDQNSLSNLTKQSDMISAFESTAKKNLDMLVEQSGKVSRTSFPIVNKALMSGRMAVGDPEAAKLMAIVKPFVDEYAKILSGQTGAAGASDTARREAAGIIAGYMSHEQIKELAPFIRQELSNRTSSLDEQRELIKARMKGGGESKPHKAAEGNTVPNPVPAPQSYPTATNQATGEKLIFKDGKWQPATK